MSLEDYSTSQLLWQPSCWTPPYDNDGGQSSSYPQSTSANFLFPPSPSEAGSSSGYSPQTFHTYIEPMPVHVVCSVPLIAPKPLPFHAQTFLQFEHLPENDEDLSHPPYTHRPAKRKRDDLQRDQQTHDLGTHPSSSSIRGVAQAPPPSQRARRKFHPLGSFAPPPRHTYTYPQRRVQR